MRTDKQIAKKHFKQLLNYVNSYRGSFTELCKDLNGHNLTETHFDVNYKSICATIHCLYGHNFVVHSTVEYYDKGGQFCEVYDFSNLKN